MTNTVIVGLIQKIGFFFIRINEHLLHLCQGMFTTNHCIVAYTNSRPNNLAYPTQSQCPLVNNERYDKTLDETTDTNQSSENQ